MSKLCLAKGSAGPCKRRIRGDQKRCRFHGGASPQARRASEERALVAAVARDSAGRDPRVILLDSVQRLDELVRRGAVDGDAAFLDRLVTVIKMAKIVCDAGVAERLTAEVTRDREMEGRLLVEAMEAAIGRLLDHLVAHHLVAAKQREALRVFTLGCAFAHLGGTPAPELPPELQTLPAALASAACTRGRGLGRSWSRGRRRPSARR
jgi:hypothetical protein